MQVFVLENGRFEVAVEANNQLFDFMLNPFTTAEAMIINATLNN